MANSLGSRDLFFDEPLETAADTLVKLNLMLFHTMVYLHIGRDGNHDGLSALHFGLSICFLNSFHQRRAITRCHDAAGVSAN
jgi:hypothetical protein